MKNGWPNLIAGATSVAVATTLGLYSTSEDREHAVTRKEMSYILEDLYLNKERYPLQTLDKIRLGLSDEKLRDSRYIREETRKFRQELKTYCEKATTNHEEVKFAEEAMLARAEQVIINNQLRNPAYLGISAGLAGLVGLGSIVIGLAKRNNSSG